MNVWQGLWEASAAVHAGLHTPAGVGYAELRQSAVKYRHAKGR